MFRNELTIDTPTGKHIHSIEYNHLSLEEYRRGLAAMRQFINDATDKLPSITFEYSITRSRRRISPKHSRYYWVSAGTNLWSSTLAVGEKMRLMNSHRIIVSAPNNHNIESGIVREMMIKHMDKVFAK